MIKMLITATVALSAISVAAQEPTTGTALGSGELTTLPDIRCFKSDREVLEYRLQKWQWEAVVQGLCVGLTPKGVGVQNVYVVNPK